MAVDLVKPMKRSTGMESEEVVEGTDRAFEPGVKSYLKDISA